MCVTISTIMLIGTFKAHQHHPFHTPANSLNTVATLMGGLSKRDKK